MCIISQTYTMVVVTSLNPKKCLLFPAADDFGDGFC